MRPGTARPPAPPRRRPPTGHRCAGDAGDAAAAHAAAHAAAAADAAAAAAVAAAERLAHRGPVHAHAQTDTHARTRTHTDTHTHARAHAHAHARTHAHRYAHTHRYTHARAHARTHTCARLCESDCGLGQVPGLIQRGPAEPGVPDAANQAALFHDLGELRCRLRLAGWRRRAGGRGVSCVWCGVAGRAPRRRATTPVPTPR